VNGLGEKLKAAREKAGLSQVVVAEKSGVARANLSAFENGSQTPTLATLYKLAEAYGVDVCDLLPRPQVEQPAEEVPEVKKGKKK